MNRFDNCICGTSSTGTGTLSLAATPVPPGGVDFDVWARATGVGFGNSAAILVDYTLVEYTDTTFATAKQTEAGIGTLTLGSSSGIANASLARTTIQATATSLNSPPASVTASSPSAISLGTAANVLVFISPRALSVPGYHPYYETTLSDSNWGANPDSQIGTAAAGLNFPTTNTDCYIPFRWSVPLLAKRLSFRVSTYSGVSGTAIAYCRIYDFNTSGRPGKLLYDFTPSSGVTVSGTGNYSTGAAGNGFLLMPGDYLADFALTGVTAGTVTLMAAATSGNTPPNNRLGSVSGIVPQYATATSPTAGAGPDPANTTSYALVTSASNIGPKFGLSPT